MFEDGRGVGVVGVGIHVKIYKPLVKFGFDSTTQSLRHSPHVPVMSSTTSYAPGWLADLATVGSALKKNYSALGPFEASDVVIGMTYLMEEERSQRAKQNPDEIHRHDAVGVLCPGPDSSTLTDLRKLCVFVEASYLEDKSAVAAAVEPLGHVVVISKPESKFQQPAFFVSRSDATGDVHLVVRGTASLKDALTDADCDAEALFTTENNSNALSKSHAHRGMAKAARWIVDECAEVLRSQIALLETLKKNAKVTILGHSLGAGTAALAAAILHETSIPNLRCVAFATPPCLDFQGAEACQKFLTSIVLHDDVITRASLANVEDLRFRLQQIDWRSSFVKDTPKLQLAVSSIGAGSEKMAHALEKMQKRTKEAAEKGANFAKQAAGRLFAKIETNDIREKGEGKVSQAAGAAADAALAAGKAGMTAASSATAAAGSLASKFGASLGLGKKAPESTVSDSDERQESTPPPKLFVPGKVFHLRRDMDGAGASSALVDRHVGTMARIELSSSLVADHSLSEYSEALATLAVRSSKKSPKVEVEGTLEWREVNSNVKTLTENAPLVAALGGFALSGPIGAVAMGGAAFYAQSSGKSKSAADEMIEAAKKWSPKEKCFVMAHETCLKIRASEGGELRPKKFELFGGRCKYAVRRVPVGDTAEGDSNVLEIYEVVDGEKCGDVDDAIRVRVPDGGATVEQWLSVFERCCRGDRRDPSLGLLT